MMSLKVILVLASAFCTFAHSEAETDDLNDYVVLLQEKVQVHSRKTPQLDVSDDVVADEYKLANPLKCEKEESTLADSGSRLELAPLNIVEEQSLAKVDNGSAAKADDPSGAYVLRTLLQLMTLLVLVDGMRRWKLQKEVVSISKVAACSQGQKIQEGEPADKREWIELVTAARNADEASFQKALKAGAPLTLADAWGCTPLHFAALGGSAIITKELLKQGVEVDALDAGDETPLHIAAGAGHVCICELLCGAGANLDTVNKEGFTPLVIAGHSSQEGTCRLLSDLGAGVAGLADEELPALVVSQALRKMIAE